MKLSLLNLDEPSAVVSLFEAVFAASEGEAEGQHIAALVENLISTTPANDLIGFSATAAEQLLGSIFFSRIVLPSQEPAVILSPVAVATEAQGGGVGQALINYGLQHLKSLGLVWVFTYGDPNYYSKVGFQQITESQVKAPCKLSQPEGWLAQRLDGAAITPMSGTTQCVPALSDPNYW